jgi:CubicO group peptidase (beta-lactamase class C family)
MNFDAFTQDIKDNNWTVYGAEVYEDGKLTHSFGNTDELHEIYSATKTILSIALGIAYDEGLINLDSPVLDYLPPEKLLALSDEQKATWKKITIKRLLTMSVQNLPFRPDGESGLDFSLAAKIKNPEKKEFNYTNICAYLAGVCLTKALGSDLGKFIEERIFKPLEITNYEYTRCPDGYFYGASGVKLSVHDLSKIGILLANGGAFNGKQIVSKEYVELATSVQQANKEGGYGFFIWKYKDGFSINGKWGQKCYVLPNQKLVITFLSHIEEGSGRIRERMERNILTI